ncbi:MAG: hypothetical protein ACR2FX_06855 [Chthoniobacterales bacterium]
MVVWAIGTVNGICPDVVAATSPNSAIARDLRTRFRGPSVKDIVVAMARL